MVRFQELRPSDHEQVLNLLRPAQLADPEGIRFLGLPASDDSRDIVAVGVDAGRIVAVGHLWTNRYHPDGRYIGLYVDPAYRRQRIGTGLLQHLQSAAAADRTALQTSLWETNASGIQFLAALGFNEVRRTWEPELRTDCVSDAALKAWTKAAHEDGFTLLPVPEAIGDVRGRTRLGALCRDMYTSTHTFNPPAPMEESEWLGLAMDDDVIAECSFVAARADVYVGAAFLHRDPGPGEVTFGWCGTRSDLEPQVRDLLVNALTAHQIQVARQLGFRTIQAELDSTDPAAMTRLRTLPFAPAPAWLTFRRPPA